MAGTPHGLVDCYSNDGYQDIYADQMYWLYRFFKSVLADTYGYTTLVASNYAGGGEFGYHGSGSEPGNNAWFLVKFNTSAARPGGGSQLGEYYVFVQGAGNVGFGGSPGSPGYCTGSTGSYRIGIMVAFRTDGGNPWGGTTGSLGSDTKGNPVWVDGGSTLCVMDVSNSSIGSYSTSKANTAQISYWGSDTTHRTHLFADEDNFLYWQSTAADDGLVDDWFTCNLWTPLDNYTVSYPLLCMSSDTPTDFPFEFGSTYGQTGGSDATFMGGMVGPDNRGSVVCGARFDWPPVAVGSVGWHPNPYYLPDIRYDENPSPLAIIDSINGEYYPIGFNDQWMRMVYNFPHNGVNNDGTKTVLSGNSTVQADWRVVLPYGGTPLYPLQTITSIHGRSY
jgi:hypothetical protein